MIYLISIFVFGNKQITKVVGSATIHLHDLCHIQIVARFGNQHRLVYPVTSQWPMMRNHFLHLFLMPSMMDQGASLSTSSLTTAGIDLGTSGARVSVVETDLESGCRTECFSSPVSWREGGYDDPVEWISSVKELFRTAKSCINTSTIQSICISGTSASCLVVDSSDLSCIVHGPRMYDFAVPKTIARLAEHAPNRHTTLSPTSSLNKLLDWHETKPLTPSQRLLHQADYVILNFLKDKSTTYSDWHNCLKLGYDVQDLQWPTWLRQCLEASRLSIDVLPAKIVQPGAVIGAIDPELAEELGLSRECAITAGTTDSNAAFMASGITTAGAAVTSLGSTLAIKQLSASYVEDSTRGVYSHRFPSTDQSEREMWLVGGASNVGCAVLRQQMFSENELEECSMLIDPADESPLQYYPLTKTGERFPVPDAKKQPVLEPVPEDRTAFLHGILQGISTVEREGYKALTEIGASSPTLILTAGGGSRNAIWTKMRERRLREFFPGVTVTSAVNTEASFGAALLAASSAVLSRSAASDT